jgi:peptidoglycan/LPS O-acetylase OafA/YrhL
MPYKGYMNIAVKQLNPLTGLRGIAALSILLGHAISSSFTYNGINALQPLASRISYFAMSLFFILSGFVIHCNYAKSIQASGMFRGGYDFFVARFARLYPLYFLALIFTIDGIPSGILQDKPWSGLSYLTLTQSWFNLQSIIFPPAWSISTEWFFYMAFLIMLPFFARIRRPVLTLAVFLIAAFIFLPNLIRYMAAISGDTNGWVIYFSPYTRIFEFIAGVLASVTYLSLDESQRKPGIFAMLSIVLCVTWCATVIFFDPLATKKYSILISNFKFAPAIAPLMILSCKYDSFISRMLASRPLLFMGKISYSVYLWQFTIITGVSASFSYHTANEINATAYFNSCLKMLVIASLTIFIASGCYNHFEKPSRRYLRKLLSLKYRKKMMNTGSAAIIFEAK